MNWDSVLRYGGIACVQWLLETCVMWFGKKHRRVSDPFVDL